MRAIQLFRDARALLCILGTLTICISLLYQTRYLVADDPYTGIQNQFKITHDSNTFLSSSKFSIDEYGLESVIRKFSVANNEFEYLPTKIDGHGQAENRVGDLNSQLAKILTAQDNEKGKHLYRLSSILSKEFGELTSLVSLTPTNKNIDIKTLIVHLEKLLISGEPTIKKHLLEMPVAGIHRPLSLNNAGYSVLSKANQLIHVVPLDNSVNFKNKSLLVFVATDTNRFTDAIYV